jgi:hypothetical protein
VSAMTKFIFSLQQGMRNSLRGSMFGGLECELAAVEGVATSTSISKYGDGDDGDSDVNSDGVDKIKNPLQGNTL